MKITIFGLSITSSWGNGHATTYRGLVKELARAGHEVVFLERDVPWYSANRDMPKLPYCRIELYSGLDELRSRFEEDVYGADLVIVGSYVPDGIAVGEWVMDTASGLTAFYDIDTPITIAKLKSGGVEYLSTGLIPKYSMYLSFTGGPMLERIELEYGSPMARPLYCSADSGQYFPCQAEKKWDLGYIGTYSEDRQPLLEKLLIEPARRRKDWKFVVAGPQYPKKIKWPSNVERIEHLPPSSHREFYCSMRYTLNITRAEMTAAGWSPSVRLFEAASCATPVISDSWDGLESFFRGNSEILISRDSDETVCFLESIPEKERELIGARARRRVLNAHTASHRAMELEAYAAEALLMRKEAVRWRIDTTKNTGLKSGTAKAGR